MTTGEAVFKSWADLSFIPYLYQQRMRDSIKQVESLPSSVELYSLALLLLLTENKAIIWSSETIQ